MITRPKGVPENALCCLFSNMEHTAYIWWWQVKPNSWYWEAAGNTGESQTEMLALEAAREWIRHGS